MKNPTLYAIAFLLALGMLGGACVALVRGQEPIKVTKPAPKPAKAKKVSTKPTEKTLLVLRISDGDTLVLKGRDYLLGKDVSIPIRIVKGDAPEVEHKKMGKNPASPLQPGGDEAKAFLEAFVRRGGGVVTIITQGKDAYGRYLAQVVIKSKGRPAQDYMLEAIKAGLAVPYDTNDKEYFAANQQAKAARLGIYKDTLTPETPREFRKRTKE